jgi:hypothetical protein
VIQNPKEAAARIENYLANPGHQMAFIMASTKKDSDEVDTVLMVHGETVISTMTIAEAWSLADFFFEMLPPRDKSTLS